MCLIRYLSVWQRRDTLHISQRHTSLHADLERYEIRPGEGHIVVRLADGEENSLAEKGHGLWECLTGTSRKSFLKGIKHSNWFTLMKLIQMDSNWFNLIHLYTAKSIFFSGFKVVCTQAPKGGGRGGDRRPYWRGAHAVASFGQVWCTDFFTKSSHLDLSSYSKLHCKVWQLQHVRWPPCLSLVSPEKPDINPRSKDHISTFQTIYMDHRCRFGRQIYTERQSGQWISPWW